MVAGYAHAADRHQKQNQTVVSSQGEEAETCPGQKSSQRQKESLFFFIGEQAEEGLNYRRGNIGHDEDHAGHSIRQIQIVFEKGKNCRQRSLECIHDHMAARKQQKHFEIESAHYRIPVLDLFLVGI